MKPAGYLVNTKEGLEGEVGVFYNYILAEDGLFIQAKNSLIAATVCIAPQVVRGLLPIEESIVLRMGKLPMHLLSLALSVLCVKPEIEQYIAVTWNGSYSLAIPTQTQNAASVTFETVKNTVLDIHSHIGDKPPYFSMVDNHDEQGFRFYAVASELRNLCPTIEIRLGVYGYFIPLGKEDIFA